MAVRIARGQVTVIDQNDAVSLQTFITSNHPLTQIYNGDANTFVPAWATTALTLTPSLFVSGKGTADQIKTVGNASNFTPGIKSGSVKWYKNGVAISSGSDNCTIGASSASYNLQVKANHMSMTTPQIKYAFEAIYIDMNGLEVAIRAEIQFTLHQTAGAALCAIAYAPDGVVFRNNEMPTLRAHCDLWRGATIDNTNVEYVWGIRDSGVFADTTTSKATTASGNTLTLSSISNIEAGSKLLISGTTHTVSSVNHSTKVVTLTANIAATANATVVKCPYYNASLGPCWALLNSGNPRGVTAGYATNEITISADAILNFDTFKCAIKDTDMSAGNTSAGAIVCDMLSFSDMSDPILVDIVSQKGFIIKNGANDVDAKAILYRNGEEIDDAGTEYTYTWKLWNAAGSSVVKTLTGKSITVLKADVVGKGALWCEVSK